VWASELVDPEEEGREGRIGEQDVLKKLGFYIFSLFYPVGFMIGCGVIGHGSRAYVERREIAYYY